MVKSIEHILCLQDVILVFPKFSMARMTHRGMHSTWKFSKGRQELPPFLKLNSCNECNKLTFYCNSVVRLWSFYSIWTCLTSLFLFSFFSKNKIEQNCKTEKMNPKVYMNTE